MRVAALVLWGATMLATRTAHADGLDQGASVSPAGLSADRVVIVRIPPPQTPSFQMGFEVARVISEDGSLADRGALANSVGVHFTFPEGRALREHLAVAHQWERQGTTSREGFRLDLLAFGFPIAVAEPREVRLAIEPVLRLLRTELLFVSENAGPSQTVLRLESGFALDFTAALGSWEVALEPMSVDFRYAELTRNVTQSGFSRIWSLALIIGRDF